MTERIAEFIGSALVRSADSAGLDLAETEILCPKEFNMVRLDVVHNSTSSCQALLSFGDADNAPASLPDPDTENISEGATPDSADINTDVDHVVTWARGARQAAPILFTEMKTRLNLRAKQRGSNIRLEIRVTFYRVG